MRHYWKGIMLGTALLALGYSCRSQNKSRAIKEQDTTTTRAVKLFLCGDVMTGRGIDQALPRSVEPVLYEGYVKDAGDYLLLAERENGAIDTPLAHEYIWGDALKVWQDNTTDLKLINLETSITTNEEPWPGKGIHYRMHPENVAVLTAAGIDHCSLANNHTLDWGRPGLEETMRTLKNAGIAFSGVGNNAKEAAQASILDAGNAKVLVFSYGSQTSGVPGMWAAEPGLSGVNLLPEMTDKEIRTIHHQVESVKKPGDIVVFSIHWGDNWGYDIPARQRDFAHQLIDQAGVDVIYGHSSHHPKGIEVYKEKLILYGAGDFITDYEGIQGHQEYRGELTLMYFPELDPATGRLKSLKLVPMEVRKFRLNHPDLEEAEWLQDMLNREGEKLGTGVRMDGDQNLWLEW